MHQPEAKVLWVWLVAVLQALVLMWCWASAAAGHHWVPVSTDGGPWAAHSHWFLFPLHSGYEMVWNRGPIWTCEKERVQHLAEDSEVWHVICYSQGCFKMPVGLLVRDVPSQQPIWGVVSCTCLWEDCNVSHVHVATYSGGAGLLEWLLSPRFKASLPAIELSWIVNVLLQTVLR